MSYIAVEGFDNASITGAMIFWRLSSGAHYARLLAELRANGVLSALHPAPPTPAAVLNRVLNDRYAGRNCLVRPLAKGTGYAIMPRLDVEGRPEFKTSWSVQISVAANKAVELTFSDDAPEAEITPVEDGVSVGLTKLGDNEMSSWMSQVVKHLQAVSMRESGGVYFIPAAHVETWRAINKSVRARCPGMQLYEVPVVRTEQAIEAVLESLTENIAKEVALASNHVEELETKRNGGTKIQQRSVDGVTQKLGELLQKVKRYEAVLGVGLEGLQKQVEAVQTQVGIAFLPAGGL